MEGSNKKRGHCLLCGAETSNQCSECKSAYYCSIDHQQEDADKHKQNCVRVPSNAMCTRCGEVIVVGSECLVPHPAHLQENICTILSGGIKHVNRCLACKQSYTKSTTDWRLSAADIPITSGPVWCYQGSHITEPITGDERRVKMGMVELPIGESSNLQQRLDELDGSDKVCVLKIGGEGCYDSTSLPKISLRLPNLEELHLDNVAVAKLELTTKLTPKLRKISMNNPTENQNPDFVIELPELRDFSCRFYDGSNGWLTRMLKKATKLERFDSYKLRVNSLVFHSNDLQRIRLQRAELMTNLEIWAPRLTQLDISGAHELEKIKFCKSHPLKKKLPEDFWLNEPLSIKGIHDDMEPQVLKALEAHPRVFPQFCEP